MQKKHRSTNVLRHQNCGFYIQKMIKGVWRVLQLLSRCIFIFVSQPSLSTIINSIGKKKISNGLANLLASLIPLSYYYFVMPYIKDEIITWMKVERNFRLFWIVIFSYENAMFYYQKKTGGGEYFIILFEIIYIN